jgi:hypothetical protein
LISVPTGRRLEPRALPVGRWKVQGLGSGCGDGAEKEVAVGKVDPHTSICSFQKLLDEVMTPISEIPWYYRYGI